MKRILFILALLCLEKSLAAQYVYTIKADSVKITNSCDTAELIIENHTQNVPGFLYNKGRGRTEFRRITKLNDSSLVFGGDTLSIKGGITANNGLNLLNSNVQLGQQVGAVGNPAALLEHREIPTNGFNTVFTGTGKVGIGTNTPVQSLSVNGSFGVTSANGYISSLAGGYPATAYVSQ